MHRMAQALLLLLFLQCIYADVDAPCYFPGGNPASGYFPCDPTAYITQCCPQGWTCYSNGICEVTDPSTANSTYPIGTSMRGTCTDPEWNNAVCGEYCLDSLSSDGIIQACGNGNFCCANDQASGKCDCKSDNGTFSIGTGVFQTIIGITGTSNTAPPYGSVGESTSSTSIIFSTASTSGSTSITPSSTAKETPSTVKPIDKPAVKAGIAVGVVGAIALLSGLYLLWRCCYRPNNVQPEGPPDVEMDNPYVSMNQEQQSRQDPLAGASRSRLNPPAQSSYPYGQGATSTTDTTTTSDRRQMSGTLLSNSTLNTTYDSNSNPNRSMTRTLR